MKYLFFIFALIVNCGGCVLAGNIALPLYMDSLLTIAVTAIGGLWWGIACAVISNMTLHFTGYTMWPFTFCHVATAVFAWLTFLYYKKKSHGSLQAQNFANNLIDFPIDAFLWAGVWSAFSNGLLGNIISSMLFPFESGIAKVDNIAQAIYLVTNNLTLATYISGTLTNITDKLISGFLSFFVWRVYKKIISA